VGWSIGGVVLAIGLVLPLVDPSTARWNPDWIYPLTDPVNQLMTWVKADLYPITKAITTWVTTVIINPLESVLTSTPFFITIALFAVLGFLLGRTRTAVTATICLVGCVLLGLWPDSMVSLTQVIIAAALTMVLGLLFGVWIGRSPVADRILRPTLDAGQVLPPFVYLVPCLALFGATRFTAIVAAVAYAAPAAIKIIGEGIATVPTATMEASRSVGSTSSQEILKVQVPMARPLILVALNQGIIFVMAMVAIGGLVGGGGLGYDVVAGFQQSALFGLGLAAGIAIVFLGIMLDRITQAAGTIRRTTSDVG
jgi:glycine betaine/proline transport system permease protein